MWLVLSIVALAAYIIGFEAGRADHARKGD